MPWTCASSGPCPALVPSSLPAYSQGGALIAVLRVTSANIIRSKKKPLDALLQYAIALVELYPWTGSALLWGAEDAFGLGIAQL